MEEPRKQPPPPNIPTADSQPKPEPPAPPSQHQSVLRQESRPAPPYRPDQKRPFLNRSEVRTLEKDMNRVREEEARKEQQRIAELKALREAEKEEKEVERIRASALAIKKREEAQHRQEMLTIQDSILPPGEERRIRDLPSPPSKGKKVFARLIIVIFFAFIALNVVLFGAWFFFFRGEDTSFRLPLTIPEIILPEIPFISNFLGPSPDPTPPPQPPASPPTTPPVGPPAPPAGGPQSPAVENAIRPAHETTLQFTASSDLSELLGQFLAGEQRAAFTELTFRQREDSSPMENGTQFFDLFGVSLPASIAPHFSGDTFFFLYSYQRGNRFGMIMETSSPQEAKNTLRQWESQTEQDLAQVMSFWGGNQKTAAYTTNWRSSAHGGIEIRFQTFSLQDYGIVYAVVDNYVIFASSFEATAAAIEALQASAQSSVQNQTFAVLQENALRSPPPLSLQQKIGQVLMIGFEDATFTPQLQETMKRLQPGGVLLLSHNIKSIEQLKRLTQDLQRASLEYSGLPLFIAVDQEGGAISRIDFGREKTAQSVIQDTGQAYQVGQLRAEELTFLGINLNLSPVLDSTQPEDFLFSRTFQAGGLEAGQLAKALLEGQQQGGILSTAKHFPGYGGITFNPEKKLAVVQEFPDISAFVFALAAKPEFLLLSHVIYANFDPDQPFPSSAKGISHIRSDLKFEGLIITDDLAQPSLLDNYNFATIATSPLKAGTNMVMFSKGDYAKEAYNTLSAALEENDFLKKRVEDSAAQIVELKKDFFFSSQPILLQDHLSQK